MPSAENAILYYEASQNPVAMTQLTDQGDLKTFKSAANLWSNVSGKAPVIRPNGLQTGGVIIPAVSGSNNVIDISEAKAYLAGVLTTVSAGTDVSVTRPTVNDFQKFSVTITSGGAFAVVEGTEGTSWSDTRGAAGGPPWIDEDAIEIGQIWYDSQTAAPVAADEIKQVPGLSQERWDDPVWDVVRSEVENGILGYAGINFVSALQGIHSEDAGVTIDGKQVYASWHVPVFIEAVDAYDFVPPSNSHTVNTQQVYGRTRGSRSQSINPGSFSQLLNDGVTDNILRQTDDFIWFKMYPDRLKAPYVLCQGSLGYTGAFPAGANISAAFTINPDVIADRVFS